MTKILIARPERSYLESLYGSGVDGSFPESNAIAIRRRERARVTGTRTAR